jgi:hypothetical protein
MNHQNRASNFSYVAKPGVPLAKTVRVPNAVPVRASQENAWANANRAWMIACRLAATRR